MEIIMQNEYMDIYRLKYGVLLIVDKFQWITYVDENSRYSYVNVYLAKAKTRLFDKNCKDLRVLKEDYFDTYYKITVPRGTVLYLGRPIEPTKDKSRWTYEVKTTGSSFSGTYGDITNLIFELLNTIKKENDYEHYV